MIASERRSSVTDREDLAVVVAALALDRRGVAGERTDLVGGQLLQAFEVDDDLRRGLGSRRDAPLGKQFGHGHAVEVGEFGQLLDGDGTVAALVGAHDDRLPAAARLLLDPVQRQALLLSDGAELAAQRLGVVAHVATSFFAGVGRGTDVESSMVRATGVRDPGLGAPSGAPRRPRPPGRTRSIRRVILGGTPRLVKPRGPSSGPNRPSPLERLIDIGAPGVTGGEYWAVRGRSGVYRTRPSTVPFRPPGACGGGWYTVAGAARCRPDRLAPRRAGPFL